MFNQKCEKIHDQIGTPLTLQALLFLFSQGKTSFYAELTNLEK